MYRTEKTAARAGESERAEREDSRLTRLNLAGQLAQGAVAIGTVAIWLVSALAGLLQSPLAITLLADGALLLAGLFHLRAVDIRLSRRWYTREPRLGRLADADRRFAWRWIGFAVTLALLALILGPGLVLGLIGAVGGFAIYLNGVLIGVDVVRAERDLLEKPDASCCSQPTPLLPGTAAVARRLGRRRALGRITRRLAIAMVIVACSALSFAGLALGALLSDEGDHLGPKTPEKRRPAEVGSGDSSPGSVGAATAVLPEPLTYAELCIVLPDPLDIEHGLGELFRRAGAVKAGCGERARAALGATGVYIAEGICSGKLRSLAVASPGYQPVLLYGEAAAFAKDAADGGQLLFVDGAEPGSGEVAVIGTTSGNYLFARSSPYLQDGDDDALRCSEVGGTPRPFAELAPPQAMLWRQHVELLGWAWPVERPGAGAEMVLVAEETGTEVATLACEVDHCELEGTAGLEEHLEYTGIAYVGLSELAPFMPAHAG